VVPLWSLKGLLLPKLLRYWDIIDEHKVTQFYVAPTALRLLKRAGASYIENHSLKSLRCLVRSVNQLLLKFGSGTLKKIGKNEIPCRHLLANRIWFASGPAGWWCHTNERVLLIPFFGIEAVVLDPNTGEELNTSHAEGVLAVKAAWPSFARTIWKNHDRYLDTY
ncbi:AMP-binding enzyme family protein, partial [Saccharomyces cerevisiae]